MQITIGSVISTDDSPRLPPDRFDARAIRSQRRPPKGTTPL